MHWHSGPIELKRPNRTIPLFGRFKDGIGVIECRVDADDLVFHALVHLQTGTLIGFLFCNPFHVQSVVGEIVQMQDWSTVQDWSELPVATSKALAEFKSRHLLLPQLPPELKDVIIQSEDPEPKPRRRKTRSKAVENVG